MVQTLPALYLRGRDGLDRFDLEDAATFGFGGAGDYQSRFGASLSIDPITFGDFAPFVFSTTFDGTLAAEFPVVSGAPIAVRDTETGEYVLFGVYNDSEAFEEEGIDRTRIDWSSVWNPDLVPAAWWHEWQHGDWIESIAGLDRDLDGRPDGTCWPVVCENPCMTPPFVDPAALDYAHNSNSEVEQAFAADPSLDWCDGAPVFALGAEPSGEDAPSQDSGGEGAASAVHFRGYATMGSEAVSDIPFEEKIAFRFCDCFDEVTGSYLDAEACLWGRDFIPPLCDLRSAHLWRENEQGDGGWVRITPELKDGGNRIPVDGNSGGAAQVFAHGYANQPAEFVWNWYGPAKHFLIDSTVKDSMRTTSGYLASFVVPAGPQRSWRDDDYFQKLRVSVKYFEFPDFVQGDLIPALDPWIAALAKWPFNWDHPNPKEWVAINSPFPPIPPVLKELTGAWNYLPHAGLVAETAKGRFYLYRKNQEGVDVTSALSPRVRGLYSEISGEWAKVGPVEPRRFLERQGSKGVSVALARDDLGRDGLVLIEEIAGGLQVRGEGWEPAKGNPEVEYGGPPTVPGVTLRGGAELVFSAWEEAVYVLGGIESDGVIQQIDIGAGTVEGILPSDPPTDLVISATYDVFDKTLYYLDVAERPGGDVVRLRAYDVATDLTQDLWELPYLGVTPFVSLDLSANRELVLTTGDDSSFSAWLIDRQTGAFGRRLDGDGKALNAPFMSETDHALPYLDSQGEFGYRIYHPSAFVEGDPCTAL